MEITLYSVAYKNHPKVYGIDMDYTDGYPLLSDLLERITGVDGVELEAYKAKIMEISQRKFGNCMGHNGKVQVTNMLSQAWEELKYK